ncbi:endonuclease domain-containing protein [Vitreimonas sp.]|uniref:endonuclease domain-containing protein n=1 Tax=Vitreimonas sp. TaxID=3069702 RepID=UPI0039C912B2
MACARDKAAPRGRCGRSSAVERFFGAKFRRQHPVEKYIADFACVDAKLIVEVDGLSHTIPEQVEFDAERDRVLGENGWRVFRVKDSDVLSNAPVIAAKIEQALMNPLPPLGGRGQGEGGAPAERD